MGISGGYHAARPSAFYTGSLKHLEPFYSATKHGGWTGTVKDAKEELEKTGHQECSKTSHRRLDSSIFEELAELDDFKAMQSGAAGTDPVPPSPGYAFLNCWATAYFTVLLDTWLGDETTIVVFDDYVKNTSVEWRDAAMAGRVDNGAAGSPAVVVDCGSSGSRPTIFNTTAGAWPMAIDVDDAILSKKTPGISTQATTCNRTLKACYEDYFKDMIPQLKSELPKLFPGSDVYDVPIYLLATATGVVIPLHVPTPPTL